MRGFFSGLLGTLVAAGYVVAASPASAQTVQLTAELSGRNEVPPLQSNGTGNLIATFDPETRVLSWTITYQGLPDLPVAMHFHGPADTSRNAGIAVPVTGNLASPIRGLATLTESQAANLLAGHYYLNVHTIAHPAGELRGQVLVVSAPAGDKQPEQARQTPDPAAAEKAAQDAAARAAAEKAARDAAAAKAAAEKAAAEKATQEAAARAAAEKAARDAAAAKAAAEKAAAEKATQEAAARAAAEKAARDAAAAKAAAEKAASDKAAAEQIAKAASQRAPAAPLDATACQAALDQLTAKEPVSFRSGSAVISNASLSLLNRIKAVMLECQTTRIVIGGHTDSIGSERGNQALSQRRAQAVVDFMVKGGVARDNLTAAGFGSAKPIASNANAEGRARNRRIEFIAK